MKRPPKDGKEYLYDEKRRKWIEIKEKDGYGFPLTTERVELLKPYPSWIFSEKSEWIPPIPIPEDGGPYMWREDVQEWVLVSDIKSHDHLCSKCGKENWSGHDTTHNIKSQLQPWPSWYLAEDGIWTPPIPMPEDGEVYEWDEYTQEWFLISQEILSKMFEES